MPDIPGRRQGPDYDDWFINFDGQTRKLFYRKWRTVVEWNVIQPGDNYYASAPGTHHIAIKGPISYRGVAPYADYHLQLRINASPTYFECDIALQAGDKAIINVETGEVEYIPWEQ